MNFDSNVPHTRVNILTGEKVLVSPHRNKRPWQGKRRRFLQNGEMNMNRNVICVREIKDQTVL
jgi:galactose-1-phosphate uridylyltransferase